jgi:V8-like Glu-specific endopeptidase
MWPYGKVSGKVGNVSVIGFGIKSGDALLTLNQAQTRHSAPVEWIKANKKGLNWHKVVAYTTDTTGGDSGGPILDDSSGLLIGIHANGGCSSTGGYNYGTLISNTALQHAVRNPLGVCATLVTKF